MSHVISLVFETELATLLAAHSLDIAADIPAMDLSLLVSRMIEAQILLGQSVRTQERGSLAQRQRAARGEY